MRIHGAALQFGLFTVGVFGLVMLLSADLKAQIVPTPASQSGSVTGVVRTSGGMPASGIRVTAMRVESTDDRLRSLTSLSQTDSTGHYRLEGVPPGRYYITAGRVDVPTYYPGTLDMTKGTVVAISSIAVVSDIDFVVQDTSVAATTVPGLPGLRSGGPAANVPILNFTTLLNGVPVTVGNTFQAQGGPALRGGGQGTGGAPRNGGPTPPPAPQPPGAAWWTNSALVARLGLTDDQKKKIEATYEQYRQALVQNVADLQKEEAALDRMLGAEPMEPAKTVMAQIDRVVQSRGEMERTNSKMAFEIRQNLTRTQWVQLQTEAPQAVVIAPAGTAPGNGARSANPQAGRGVRSTTPPAPPVVPPPASSGAR